MSKKNELGGTIRHARGSLGRAVAMRLPPGEDIMRAIEKIAVTEQIGSGVILSGLGSLSQVTLRNVRQFPEEFPIQDRHRIFSPRREPMELLALTGNLSRRDEKVWVHAHAVVSSGVDGSLVFGGHLVEGCIVLSTAEIVICGIEDLIMMRRIDPETKAFEIYFSQEQTG